MRSVRSRLPVLLALALVAPACGGSTPSSNQNEASGDLPLGEVSSDDLKADGVWGAATTCKAIPDLPALVAPQITVSLHGLTLHLTDAATGYDRVFPIGPGAIDEKSGSLTYKESLSWWPVKKYGTQDFAITPASSTACKIWWTDPANGQKLPVFAGLPFLSWSGSYAIHGPVDSYRADNGGSLRRGFVSHGCLRMRAEDILEVYGRIRGVARVPVHVQREPERWSDGGRVDVASPWLGAECVDQDGCPFEGGFCKLNRYSGRGFCTSHCTRYCLDRSGEAVSFCAPDPDDSSLGICVPKQTAVNYACRPYDHLVSRTVSRLNDPATTATVCLPGSPGWIGDHCFLTGECRWGLTCVGADAEFPGVCTQPCTQYCPDEPGYSTTFCVDDEALGGAACARRCTAAAGAPECPADSTCEALPRNGQTSPVREVCLPE